MGVLNFEEQPHHRRKITDALRHRGLMPDLVEEWEVHGPHAGMNFQVYVGYAVSKDDPLDCFCVAISLHGTGRGVYEIDDPTRWGERSPDKKIPIEEEGRGNGR